MLSSRFALCVGGAVVASCLALACAQSVDDGPLIQDDVGVVKDSNDAGTSPTHDNGTKPSSTRDSGTSAAPDAGSAQDTGATQDSAPPGQDSAIDQPGTGNTNVDVCNTSGLDALKYAAEFLSAVDPCPCAATECCYQQLACVPK